MTPLIENFEEKRYQLARATPRQALAFRKEQHGVKQKDLVEIFGMRSVVSEAMSPKREPTKGTNQTPSRHFNVSPELFF